MTVRRGRLVRGIAALCSVALLAVPTLAAAASSTVSSSAASSPASVFTSFMTALASGNAQSAAADLAPSISWSIAPSQALPPTFPTTASGLTSVGALLTEFNTAKVQFALTGTPQVSGDTVTWDGTMSAPALTTLGVSSVQVQGTTTVSGTQITVMSIQIAASSVTALETALTGASAAASTAQASTATKATAAPTTKTTSLPKTGQGPLPWIAGLLLVVAGTMLVGRVRFAR